MDTAHWPQEIVVKPIEEIVTNTCPKPGGKISSRSTTTTTTTKEQQILNCPRCNSTNTKFCYYNNYSLTQPRYFCKTCRRYWTEGGSLRNIPVGGGSRKNKRSSSSSSNNNNNNINYSSSNNSSSLISSISSLNSNKKLPDLITPPSSNSSNSNQFQNPNQDLNLAFPSNNNGGPIRSFSELIQLPISTSGSSIAVAVSADQLQSQQMSALELLTGFSSRGLNSFLPASMQIHHHHHHQDDPNSLGFQDFKLPSLNFSLDHHGNINGSSGGGGYGNSSMQENTSGGRLLFPFEDLKQQVSSNKNNINNGENEIEDHDQQNRDQQGDDHHSAGYWSGMLGGGVNGSW